MITNQTERGAGSCLKSVLFLLVVLLAPAETFGQSSLFDPRFDELRKASEEWDRRAGPDRQVVDMVCLVPDVPTFLEAIKVWDCGHFFPILIDDVEYSFKFLRAFRPARIVRFPGKGEPGDTEQLWERAINSIGESWDGKKAENANANALRGDAIPKILGPTPPGVVLSHPDSPSFAGAVALAAGRFQPLWKWESTPKRFVDIATFEEAKTLAAQIDALLKVKGLDFEKLGDDCDFITLAGDYPYRYTEQGQHNAIDDLIMRSTKDQKRNGYAGRLMGGPVESLYRAMCSLFLHPKALTFFNTYGEAEQPWSRFAALPVGKLASAYTLSMRSGNRAGLAGWHEQFEPLNRAGLLLINSSGGSISFRIDAQGGQAHTADIPESDPVAVHIIHSFSAETPDDADTLSGRWLANGAFVYYGSVNEPYLEAFRTPNLVATLLADNLPFAAACRKLTGEPFAQPWRLMLIGEPLYRLRPVRPALARLQEWNEVITWAAYPALPRPPVGASDMSRLGWALRAALYRWQTSMPPQTKQDSTEVLLSVNRDRLDVKYQGIYDDLLVDLLVQAGRFSELIARLSRISPVNRSPVVRRHLETAQMSLLQHAVSKQELKQAITLWGKVILAPELKDYVRVFTERVGDLAQSTGRVDEWKARLKKDLETSSIPMNKAIIEAELKRMAKSK